MNAKTYGIYNCELLEANLCWIISIPESHTMKVWQSQCWSLGIFLPFAFSREIIFGKYSYWASKPSFTNSDFSTFRKIANIPLNSNWQFLIYWNQFHVKIWGTYLFLIFHTVTRLHKYISNALLKFPAIFQSQNKEFYIWVSSWHI